MSRTTALPPAYRAALLAAAAAALDAGIFYQDPFEVFVLDRTAGCDPAQNEFLGVFEEPEAFNERSVLRTVVEAQVTQAPRGTWAVIRLALHESGRTLFRAVMSDGSGRLAVGGSFDTYDGMPDFATGHCRMAGYEAYLARHEVEAERSRARNLALIAHRGFAAGRSYRNLSLGGSTYSTVTITALHPTPPAHLTIVGTDDRGTGWLTLSLTKRGSRRRWSADLAAATLAAAIDGAELRKDATNKPGRGCPPVLPVDFAPAAGNAS